MAKQKRNWMWRRLEEREAKAQRRPRATNYRRPDFMTNKHGQTVRMHAPHPTTPAFERFMEFVRTVPNLDDLDCWQWTGGDTFRVDELTVTTPARFMWRWMTGEKLSKGESLHPTCKTPRCVRPSHREKREK